MRTHYSKRDGGPVIHRDEIERRAREAAVAAGYPWVAPILVTPTRLFLFFGRLLSWHVCSNSEMRGGNVNVHLSRTGSVTKIAFAHH